MHELNLSSVYGQTMVYELKASRLNINQIAGGLC